MFVCLYDLDPYLNTTIVSVRVAYGELKWHNISDLNTTIVSVRVTRALQEVFWHLFKYNHCVGSSA